MIYFAAGAPGAGPGAGAGPHRGTRNPRSQAQKFSKPVLLTKFS